MQPPTPEGMEVTFRRYRTGSWTVIEAAGEIDLQVTPAMQEVLDGAGSTRVVFDLREVTFMGSSGLTVLANAWRTAEPAGGAVRLVGPTSSVRRVLAITGLDATLPTYPSVDEAVR